MPNCHLLAKPTSELHKINTTPTAEACLTLAKLSNTKLGTRYIPPPIPILPAKNPSTAPSSVHNANLNDSDVGEPMVFTLFNFELEGRALDDDDWGNEGVEPVSLPSKEASVVANVIFAIRHKLNNSVTNSTT